MDCYVIYDNPVDYPKETIVRRFTATGGQPVPQQLIYRGSSLGDARTAIAKLLPGAICFNPDSTDDRGIVECWL